MSWPTFCARVVPPKVRLTTLNAENPGVIAGAPYAAIKLLRRYRGDRMTETNRRCDRKTETATGQLRQDTRMVTCPPGLRRTSAEKAWVRSDRSNLT